MLYEISTAKDRQEFPEPPTVWEDRPDEKRLREFHQVLLKACEREIGQRYQNAHQMHADLALLQSGKSLKQLRLMDQRRRALKHAGICALLTTLFGFALFLSPLFEKLERISFDALSALKPKATPAEVLILKLDAESLRELKQDFRVPWDRSLYAMIVERLTREKAAVCVFDIVFDKVGPDSAKDQRFAESLKRFGKAVLAADVLYSRSVPYPPDSKTGSREIDDPLPFLRR